MNRYLTRGFLPEVHEVSRVIKREFQGVKATGQEVSSLRASRS